MALLLLGVMACNSSAVTNDADTTKVGKSETLSGKLIEKPWTKSTQSYCAQGSDYFVLEVNGAEHVLAFSSSMTDKLKANAGKKVSLTGSFETKTIKAADNDPMSQRPVTSSPDGSDEGFTCTVFKVSKMN